jgi:predicted RNA-binding Zn-ribbon protein involved in translation (DUF1610 family)
VSVPPAYCPHCGERAGERDHRACAAAAALDPPRYCASCGRRMIVKVTPDHWSAVCSRHGRVNDTGEQAARPPDGHVSR